MAITKAEQLPCPECGEVMGVKGFKNHVINRHDYTRSMADDSFRQITGREAISWQQMKRNKSLPEEELDRTARCGLCGEEFEHEPFVVHMMSEHKTERDQADVVFRILASRSLKQAKEVLKPSRIELREVAPTGTKATAFVLLDSIEGQFKPVAVTMIKIEADKWKFYNPGQHEVQEFELDRLPL